MKHSDVVPIYAELLGIHDYCEQAESVSEVHGVLCGLLSRDPFVGANQWLRVLEFEGEPTETRFQMVRDQLDNLHEYSAQMLNQIDTEFSPVLPDDDEPLAQRLLELAAWCQGYLYGFSSYKLDSNNEFVETYEYEDDDDLELDSIRERAARTAEQELQKSLVNEEAVEEEELPESVEEILQDITELSQVDDTSVSEYEENDVDEASYMELLEYIRVSVQLVFEEMAGQKLAGRDEAIEVDPRFMFNGSEDENVH